MRDLPSGTVTFLFTDIEGSTRLLHELGGAYAEVLVEQRRSLVTAVSRLTRRETRSSLPLPEPVTLWLPHERLKARLRRGRSGCGLESIQGSRRSRRRGMSESMCIGRLESARLGMAGRCWSLR